MIGRCTTILDLALLLWIPCAQAQEMTLPVPRAVIYPGDTITETMIDDRVINSESVSSSYIRTRMELVGKVARRTLLPGQPIANAGVDQPRLVSIGSQVKIIYSEIGLQIVAFGVSQQSGGAGDLVRVRNLESGLFVVGRVQHDGSIRVGES